MRGCRELFVEVEECITIGCTGQISAVTFCANTRTKAAIINLLGEPGVRAKGEIVPDILSITSAMESFKTVTEMVRGIKQAAKSLEDANINFQIAELTNALADLKLALADVKEENINLREENSSLKKSVDFRAMLTLKNNVYQPVNEEINGYGKGPWCTNCYDTSGKLVVLHHKLAISFGDVSSYQWVCPHCKSSVSAPKK